MSKQLLLSALVFSLQITTEALLIGTYYCRLYSLGKNRTYHSFRVVLFMGQEGLIGTLLIASSSSIPPACPLKRLRSVTYIIVWYCLF